jgi:hypothetical protein
MGRARTTRTQTNKQTKMLKLGETNDPEAIIIFKIYEEYVPKTKEGCIKWFKHIAMRIDALRQIRGEEPRLQPMYENDF